MKFILLLLLGMLLFSCTNGVVEYPVEDEESTHFDQTKTSNLKAVDGIENEKLEYLNVIPIELNLQKDSTVSELIEGRKPLLDKTIENYHLAYGLSSRTH